MKYISFVVCAVILFVGLNGCAGSRARFASISKAGKKKITFAQTLTAELAELAKSPIRTTLEGRQEMAQMSKDNSVIQTMYDAFGNKTESRVFYNDAFLKMVVVKTSADGQKEALVYGQNGEVKLAPQNFLDKALTAVAAEIAKTVEIFEGRKENEMLARLNAPPVQPTEDFSLSSLDQTTVEESAPVAETEQTVESTEAETEMVETKKVEETKVEAKPVQTEDSSLKLRAVVQSLKATRKNNLTNELTAKAN